MASDGRGGRDKRHSEYGGGEGTFQPKGYPAKSDSGLGVGEGGPELTPRERARLMRLSGGHGGEEHAGAVGGAVETEAQKKIRLYLDSRSDKRAGTGGETGGE